MTPDIACYLASLPVLALGLGYWADLAWRAIRRPR